MALRIVHPRVSPGEHGPLAPSPMGEGPPGAVFFTCFQAARALSVSSFLKGRAKLRQMLSGSSTCAELWLHPQQEERMG